MADSLLVRNARAFTLDPSRPRAEAVCVVEGRISWVGDEADASAHMGPETEVIDAAGATLLPGFIDAHNHVRLGSNPLEVDLAGARTLEEVQGAHPRRTPTRIPGSRGSKGRASTTPSCRADACPRGRISMG